MTLSHLSATSLEFSLEEPTATTTSTTALKFYEGINYDIHDVRRSTRVYEGFSACGIRAEESEHKSGLTPTVRGATRQLIDVR